MNAFMLTKADEKKLLAETVNRMPDGYVRDILSEMRPEIERAIDSDFGFVPFAERWKESEAHRLDMLEAKRKLDLVKDEIRDLERKRATAEHGLGKIREQISIYARV